MTWCEFRNSVGLSLNSYDRVYDATPLHYALENGQYDVVKYLLDQAYGEVFHVDFFKPVHDKLGHTALHHALKYKCPPPNLVETIELFISHPVTKGIDFNAKSRRNERVSKLAKRRGLKKISELLKIKHAKQSKFRIKLKNLNLIHVFHPAKSDPEEV